MQDFKKYTYILNSVVTCSRAAVKARIIGRRAMSSEFSSYGKGGENTPKNMPQETKKNKKTQTLLGEASPTSEHTVQLFEFLRYGSYICHCSIHTYPMHAHTDMTIDTS